MPLTAAKLRRSLRIRVALTGKAQCLLCVCRNMVGHPTDWGPFCERKSSKMGPQFGGEMTALLSQ